MKATALRLTRLTLLGALAASCTSATPSPADKSVATTRSALVQPVSCVGDTNPAIDDAPAINAATGSGNEVVLPAGTCNIHSAVTLGSGVWLHGQGASTVLRARAAVVAIVYSGFINARISDLTVDAGTFSSAGIMVLAAQDATLTRLQVKNTNQAIVVQAPTGTNAGVTISENVIHETARGITVGGTPSPLTLSKILITDNSVETTSGEAIYLRGIRDVVVSGNVLDTHANVGIAIESGVSAAIIANNILRGQAGNTTSGIGMGGGALDPNSDVVVNGNMIAGYGTGLAMSHTTYSLFSHVSISANTFTSEAGATGIRVSDGIDVLLSKNQLNGGAYGIDVQPGFRGLTRLSIANNIIGGTTAGLRLASSTLTDLLVDSNTFSGTTAVQTTSLPQGRFVAASNIGWKGPSSGLHAGRNTSGTCLINASTSTCSLGSVPEPNTQYRVVLTPSTSNLSGVNLPKQRITAVAKTTTGFTLTTEQALTGTDSVTYDWVLLRDPT